MSDSLRPHESQHARPPCPSPTSGVHWDSCPSSQWCHPAISSSVVPFSSCPQDYELHGKVAMKETWISELMISYCAGISPFHIDCRKDNLIDVYVIYVSCSVVSDSLWPHRLYPARLLCPRDFPGKNTGMGCHSLLQKIFPTQGSNLRLLHCRQTFYHLNHKTKNKISILKYHQITLTSKTLLLVWV